MVDKDGNFNVGVKYKKISMDGRKRFLKINLCKNRIIYLLKVSRRPRNLINQKETLPTLVFVRILYGRIFKIPRHENG